MKSITIIIIFLFSINIALADKPAYKLFDIDGDEQDYEDMLEEAAEANIVFFGELHNNPICHWLQLELTKALHDEVGERLVLGAEMFESDNQLIIDEYLSGKIPQSNFEKEVRLWNNYRTDYKPLLEFANDNDLVFIATNIPRRYAAFVARNGLESLNEFSNEAKKFFPPLPIEVDLNLKCYSAMDDMMSGMHSAAQKDGKKSSMKEINDKMKELTPDEREEKMKKMMDAMKKAQYFKEAQAVKDATMAHFILQNMNDDNVFIHYNGTYHSDNHESIVWFIKRDATQFDVITIASVLQSDIDELDEKNLGLADYIIVIPENMTTTY